MTATGLEFGQYETGLEFGQYDKWLNFSLQSKWLLVCITFQLLNSIGFTLSFYLLMSIVVSTLPTQTQELNKRRVKF